LKSLAELKRSIHNGSLLKMVRHDWFKGGAMTVHGNTGTSQLKGNLLGVVRPVTLVQANQIALEKPIAIGKGCWQGDGKKSYLTWPKASNVRFTERNDNGVTVQGFEIDLNGDGKFSDIMAYEDVTYKANTHCECGAAYDVVSGGYLCAR
jgi:hypothetical protein